MTRSLECYSVLGKRKPPNETTKADKNLKNFWQYLANTIEEAYRHSITNITTSNLYFVFIINWIRDIDVKHKVHLDSPGVYFNLKGQQLLHVWLCGENSVCIQNSSRFNTGAYVHSPFRVYICALNNPHVSLKKTTYIQRIGTLQMKRVVPCSIEVLLRQLLRQSTATMTGRN